MESFVFKRGELIDYCKNGSFLSKIHICNKITKRISDGFKMKSYVCDVNKNNYRRSLYTIKCIKKNETIYNEHIVAIRPGVGLDPSYVSEIVGKKANRDLGSYELIKLEYFY